MSEAQPSQGKNTIADLRGHLFATIEALRDPEKPMDIERARAVSDVAQTIINTAKVEVEFARATGVPAASGFIPLPAPTAPEIPERLASHAPQIPERPTGLKGVTQHLLK